MRTYSRQRMSFALACMMLATQPHPIFAQEEGRPGRADSAEQRRPDAGANTERIGRDADARRRNDETRFDRKRGGDDVARDTNDARRAEEELQELKKITRPDQARELKFSEKIDRQMRERGWTEQEVKELAKKDPAGISIDGRNGRQEPATVYGERGRYIVVNDSTREVVQVSDKTKSDWGDDSRIQWK